MNKRVALKTSYGPFSSGTRFEVISLNKTAGYAHVRSLSPIARHNPQLRRFDIHRNGYASLDIEADLLVELRNRG